MFANFAFELNVDVAFSEFKQLVTYLESAAKDPTSTDEVERKLFDGLLALGRELFGAFLKSVGNGDIGVEVTLERPGEEPRTIKRLAGEHKRRLRTVFGEFVLSRCVYGTGEKKAIEFVPIDQRLTLPESEVSYLLQEWSQLLAIDQSYGATQDIIQSILKIKTSVDSLERGTQRMAESAESFRAQQPAPDPEQEGELLVATEDNKGIPIVRPADVVPPGAHPTRGQKKNKKKFATVGCVYSVERHVRTPEELVATLFRDEERPKDKPPKSEYRRYYTRLTRQVINANGEIEEIHGQRDVFQQLQKEIAARRKPGQKLLNLSDGQRTLEIDRQEYLPTDSDTVDILDLLHVLPRLWKAAYLFHGEGNEEAPKYVRRLLLRVLKGQSKSVVSELRRQGTLRKLKGANKNTLRVLTNFLEENLHRMRYDEYLAAGYPIASGVIEGACRHIVKDRMERTGMRWKIPGAQALLELRTIHINGDWVSFQNFRIQSENKRLYPYTVNAI